MLRYVCTTEHYSEYTDDDGEPVYLSHSSNMHGVIRLVDLSDLDVEAEYATWQRSPYRGNTLVPFTEWIGAKMIDPDEVDDIVSCSDCSEPVESEFDLTTVSDGDRVCEDCFDNYWTCDRCEVAYPDHTNSSAVGDSHYCNYCVDEATFYCEYCGERYHIDDQYEHAHDDGRDCSCEAPHQDFAVAVSDGSDTVDSDTETTVTLPDGWISEQGREEITILIHQWISTLRDERGNLLGWSAPERQVLFSVNQIGSEWKTAEGTFPKRLRSHVYKTTKATYDTGFSVPKDLLAKIGTIAETHSRGVEVKVEVTRDLNLDAEEFAHGDSCWWTEYAYSRCTLKSNGGFGIRSFGYREHKPLLRYEWNDDRTDYKAIYADEVYTYREVSGRAWVIPFRVIERHLPYGGGRTQRVLQPVTDTLISEGQTDGFLVFNGYGDLSEMTAPRVLAAMTGLNHARVTIDGDTEMYVNGESGHVVASPEVIEALGGKAYVYLDRHATLPAPTSDLALV